jgi:SAM-dependent methyltransferase
VSHAAARLPRFLHAPLRAARTAALAALEPFDLLHRRLVGQRGLPPLWLRRHVGPLGAFDRSVGEIAATIALLELIHPGDTVLDLGCGVGAMVPDFQRFLAPHGRYVGFDVHAASIAWCRRRFAGDPRLRFELAPVRTTYSAGSEGDVLSYSFPVADASVDFALAKSLFTHLLEEEASHYLRELRRALRPEGRALVSAFLLDEASRKSPPAEAGTPDAPLYDFGFGTDRVRWLVRERPAAGVAFRRSVFVELCVAAGLQVDRIVPGHWRGGALAAPNAQDLVVLRAPAASR